MTRPTDAFDPLDLSPIHERLVRRGVIAAVDTGSTVEMERFVDCELAAMAEYRLGDGTDPRSVDPWRRADWTERAALGALPLPAERPGERCFWLTCDGRRIGTVCLGLRRRARPDMYLGSFYLFPDERGRGRAHASLRSMLFAAATQGIGLRLTTQWTWGPAVRFWLREGFWLLHWKRSLCLTRRLDTPAPVFTTSGRTASLSVLREGELVPLMRAWQRAGRLCWRTCVPATALGPDDPLRSIAHAVPSTFALYLARAGWPLVRSARKAETLGAADGGAPEGLARAISVNEAEDRACGWCVADLPAGAPVGAIIDLAARSPAHTPDTAGP
ncbi:GNAT family N-acetyltransferase [Myxococcota bacterium]|nr:GNAT family N-acetyltransferase [Myxococcota bacterium]